MTYSIYCVQIKGFIWHSFLFPRNHVITFKLSGSKLSWQSTRCIPGSISSVGILDGYDGQVWQVVLSGSLIHSWVSSTDTDHTFPWKLEHTYCAPAQAVCSILVSRPLYQHHLYACKPEYILESQKKGISLLTQAITVFRVLHFIIRWT